MGQKVNPIGMRLQVNRTWDSRWYADDKDYGKLLLEDLKIREFIHDDAKQAGISRVIIERTVPAASPCSSDPGCASITIWLPLTWIATSNGGAFSISSQPNMRSIASAPRSIAMRLRIS